ncbi:MAG: hypothetical protein JST92_17630 [Deltaproteobacteria bacterium]|nr:hypothetical protein [Deltaproteobacteria bacterium]
MDGSGGAGTTQAVPGGYRFSMRFQGGMQLADSTDRVLWSLSGFVTRGGRPVASFVAAEHATEDLEIVRTRRFPRPQFEILEHGRTLATVESDGLLRTQWTIAFADGLRWQFPLPMFRVARGALRDGAFVVKVREHRMNLWDLVFEPGQDRPEAVAAIACVHLARWRGL